MRKHKHSLKVETIKHHMNTLIKVFIYMLATSSLHYAAILIYIIYSLCKEDVASM